MASFQVSQFGRTSNTGVINQQLELEQKARQMEQADQLAFLQKAMGLLGMGGGAGGGGLSQPGSPDGGGLNSILDAIKGTGEGRKAEIEQDALNTEKSSLAALSDRGLAGSNLDTAVRDTVQRGKNRDLGLLEDQLLGRGLDFFEGQQQFGLQQQQQQFKLLTGLLGASK